MWITLGIIGVLGSLTTLIIIIGGTAGAGAYVVLAFMVLMATLGFSTSGQLRKTRKTIKESAQKEMAKRQAILFAELPHVTGLPVAENIACEIYSTSDKYEITASGNQFNIEKLKVTDVSFQTDVDIQKHISSSVGGAVGGAVLFGPLGAMVGGRSKKHETRTVTTYLIFTYNSDGEVKYIAFDATHQLNPARLFVDEFRKNKPALGATVDL